MPILPSVDESFYRLHKAGWSIGDACFGEGERAFWLVTGTKGENVLEARGTTQGEAWHNACQQAESMGTMRRGIIR